MAKEARWDWVERNEIEVNCFRWMRNFRAKI